jgi:hypothetical protein
MQVQKPTVRFVPAPKPKPPHKPTDRQLLKAALLVVEEADELIRALRESNQASQNASLIHWYGRRNQLRDLTKLPKPRKHPRKGR